MYPRLSLSLSLSAVSPRIIDPAGLLYYVTFHLFFFFFSRSKSNRLPIAFYNLKILLIFFFIHIKGNNELRSGDFIWTARVYIVAYELTYIKRLAFYMHSIWIMSNATCRETISQVFIFIRSNMNQPDKRSARDRCRISSSKCAVCPVPRVCKMFIFIYMMVQLIVFLLYRTADRNKETKRGT
jgi:hypothetical protein